MVDVITTIEIEVPLKTVAGYAMNPDNAPHWYANIESSNWMTPKPLKPGSRIAFTAHFLGRKLNYVYAVNALTDTTLVMSTAQGPFPMETTYLFEALGPNRTRIKLRNCGNPSGFSMLFSPLMSFMMKRENKKDLLKLKQILEEQEGMRSN